MKYFFALLLGLMCITSFPQSIYQYNSSMLVDTSDSHTTTPLFAGIGGCSCATPCGSITTYLVAPATWASEGPHWGETPIIPSNTVSSLQCFTFVANNTTENINMGSVVTGFFCGYSQFNWTVYGPGCVLISSGNISNLTVSGLTCNTHYTLCITFKNRCAVDSICPYVYNSNTCVPLPIQLISFTCQYDNNKVFINWVTATQLNNKEFIIERTTDGENYVEIATAPGAGTEPFTMSYTAVDDNPIDGTSYYRLKQLDMDGNETIFPPAAIFVGTNPTNSLHLYPNVVTMNAVLVYTSDNNNPMFVSIIDMVGRRISSSTFNVVTGQNTFTVNTSSLSPGIYIIDAVGDRTYMMKFIKH